MPDFAFEGPGVRVQQVMPGSAAEKAGILAGDVLVAFDGVEVTDLRTYSNLLKARSPGDEVEVTVVDGVVDIDSAVTIVVFVDVQDRVTIHIAVEVVQGMRQRTEAKGYPRCLIRRG